MNGQAPTRRPPPIRPEAFADRATLRDAMAAGQFVTHFQPEVDLETGQMLGAEALVRWQHPERGLLPAADFIGHVQRAGLLDEIGDLVLTDAARWVTEWRLCRSDPFVVRVNVSPLQLGAAFVDRVEDVLASTSASPAWLCLEILESALLRVDPGVTRTLRAVRRLGVQVVVDDFGTGYGTLIHLRRLPLDGLKIDASFVAGLPASHDDVAIVTAIVGLADALVLEVCAEGVTSETQIDPLLELGCTRAQGFLFSPAVPPEAISALIETGS